MIRSKEPTWQHEETGEAGKASLFGVNIFNYEWISTGKSTIVYDPLYHQQYSFPIYEVEINGQKYTFAAGEFSNCIWGFYTYRC